MTVRLGRLGNRLPPRRRGAACSAVAGPDPGLAAGLAAALSRARPRRLRPGTFPHHAPAAAPGPARGLGLRPYVAGWPGRKLWEIGVAIFLTRRRWALENGVSTTLRTTQVIEPLIRFAYERAGAGPPLADSTRTAGHAGPGSADTTVRSSTRSRIEISTSAHGFFAILTSTARSGSDRLQEGSIRCGARQPDRRF